MLRILSTNIFLCCSEMWTKLAAALAVFILIIVTTVTLLTTPNYVSSVLPKKKADVGNIVNIFQCQYFSYVQVGSNVGDLEHRIFN